MLIVSSIEGGNLYKTFKGEIEEKTSLGAFVLKCPSLLSNFRRTMADIPTVTVEGIEGELQVAGIVIKNP